jgi:hypothetical protein
MTEGKNDDEWKRRAQAAEDEIARLRAERFVDEVQATIGDKGSKPAARAGRLLSAIGNVLLSGDLGKVGEFISQIAKQRVATAAKDATMQDFPDPTDEDKP